MHDTLCFTSHERFPDSFTNCVHTFCRMSDRDQFLILVEIDHFFAFLKIYIYSAAQF